MRQAGVSGSENGGGPLVERLGAQFVAEGLGEILAGLAVGSEIDTSAPRFGKVATALEFFLPAVLRPEHPFWDKESLDRFRFVVARKTGPNAAEFLGLAVLILDQTWIAMDVTLELRGPPWVVRHVTCKLGEPGTGVGGLSTVAYDSPKLAGLLAGLPARREHITWVFEGEAEQS